MVHPLCCVRCGGRDPLVCIQHARVRVSVAVLLHAGAGCPKHNIRRGHAGQSRESGAWAVRLLTDLSVVVEWICHGHAQSRRAADQPLLWRDRGLALGGGIAVSALVGGSFLWTALDDRYRSIT